MRRLASLTALLTTLVVAAAAHATLTQPDGTVIPKGLTCASGSPAGLLATFACACTTAGTCNIGAACPGGSTSCDPGTNGTCESTIWHSINDNSCIPSNESGLDPVADAATTPETFRPTCALTFTLLTRGTSQFEDTFGWYNVTGSAPAASDLHPMFACGDAPGKAVVLDLSKEPAYTGGEIGFFMLTPEGHPNTKKCDASDCCPTLARFAAGTGYAFYSQREFNPDGGGTTAFIHLLTYNSRLSTTKFYFAWEDLFSGGDNNFTDLVVSVDGVQCSGGGVTCSTTKQGACAYGVTQCSAGSVSCTPLFTAEPEKCNGVDDDCDGVIDNGATCPTAGDLCHDGKCVPPCAGGEFKCDPGSVCDSTSALCVDPTCVGVSCTTGQVCRTGACVAPCGGIVCPYASTCVNDACVNLCAGVSCPSGQVCREGICFDGCASCSGVSCGSGLKCDGTTNDCVDPSCATPCAAGTHCKSGACVDDCAGATCPTGTTCTAGKCVSTAASDAGIDIGDAAFVTDAGSTGDATAGGDAGDHGALGKASTGCGCTTASRDADRSTGLALSAIAIAILGRRRRSGAFARWRARA
ncbi:MAG: DUF4114 domain-containing protein [Polyangiales bacterium]